MSMDSIRKKIEEAKKNAENILRAKGTSPEIKVAVESLLLVIDILIAVFLEKKTRKNSSNSGLPPSRNNGSNGNRNKGSGDREKHGQQLDNTRNVETNEVVSPKRCKKCNHSLLHVQASSSEDRKKMDIVYEIITHTCTSKTIECPGCGCINKGEFPRGMDGKIQYGNGIRASIIDFLTVQMMSLERVQEHFRGLIGRFISQAIMLKYIAQLSDALKEWEDRQIIKLLSAPVIYCDETSMRVGKVNHWIHSYSYGDITLKFIHPARGSEAIESINIIPRYGGTLMHDCWASYLCYKNVEHALCGSHLLRELKFIEDSTGDKWATKMKKLLQKNAMIIASRTKMGKLNTKEYKGLQSKYRNILTRGKTELPDFPEPTGNRGRPKHTDAQNLWMRLLEYESSVLMFARVKEVEFTNNRAERDLRVSKLKQKVSGCFRQLEFAEHYCRIAGYVKSMRYRGYSSLEAISFAIQGNIPE